jgi:uncharacterized membrane protein (UPF0127 family)
MNKKDKFGLLFLLTSTCLVILLIVFSESFITNTENTNKGQLAVVTFFPNNSTSVVMTCEVASSHEERLMGLMIREEMLRDEGMLFVYESPLNVSFWMKNTFIPLDIIFLDESGTVINVEEADVEINVTDGELKRYFSACPAKWVVEVNQGLCKVYGIDVGTNVSIEYL